MQMPLVVYYHTDSCVVLGYIKGEKTRFPVFVANRVQLIREFSDPDQWRYVPSSLNPADEASRGLSASKLLNTGTLWLRGPAFLLGPKEDWPAAPAVSAEHVECNSSQEVNACNVQDASSAQVASPTDRLLTHFSSWQRLARAVAIFRRAADMRLRDAKSVAQSPISAAELAESKQAIVRYVQRCEFQDEIATLSDSAFNGSSRRVKKSSKLYKLNPFLDSEGMLRVGGRLENTDWEPDAMNPILLPRKHFVTKLIIRHEHVLSGHSGRNHVLSNVRAKYWVPQGNSAVRQVISECVCCRRGRGRCSDQIMADLPQCRVDDSVPPFSYVGIDFFGPFEAKVGRKVVKRYGVMFTCMASRAIHLELAPSLDTSATINVLRRFISRRGPVKCFFSDNGTNFVGAVNEMKRAQTEVDPERVQKWAADKGFNGEISVVWRVA
jgi:hypothetical protein